jgi:hypothetical protein
VFRTLVAPRASSSTEDGGVVSDGDSATVPYLLDNCGLPSWSTVSQLPLSKGNRLQRIVNRVVDSIDEYRGVCICTVREGGTGVEGGLVGRLWQSDPGRLFLSMQSVVSVNHKQNPL